MEMQPITAPHIRAFLAEKSSHCVRVDYVVNVSGQTVRESYGVNIRTRTGLVDILQEDQPLLMQPGEMIKHNTNMQIFATRVRNNNQVHVIAKSEIAVDTNPAAHLCPSLEALSRPDRTKT